MKIATKMKKYLQNLGPLQKKYFIPWMLYPNEFDAWKKWRKFCETAFLEKNAFWKNYRKHIWLPKCKKYRGDFFTCEYLRKNETMGYSKLRLRMEKEYKRIRINKNKIGDDGKTETGVVRTLFSVFGIRIQIYFIIWIQMPISI